jgi:phage portal protein BeeE
MNLVPWRKKEVEERDGSYLSNFQEWVDFVTYQGTFYPLAGLQQTLKGNREEVGNDFSGLAATAYRSNPVVFACMETRRSHFSEARFIYRQRVKGRAGDLFGTPDLAVLEAPWPGGTTGDLLARMIQDVDLAGNFYATKVDGRIARLRPDWVAILLGSTTRRETWVAGDPDTEVAGYAYFPGGKAHQEQPILFTPEQIAHFAPIPDPLATFRGMSWLTCLVRDIQSDSMMTNHKSKFLENGATPNLIVKMPEGTSQENFNEVVETVRRDHEGARNAYKTLFLAGGADAIAVGVDMQQTDFRAVQGAGETRICSAARVPAVIAQISEGLQGSTLNAGNYQSARRMFADGCLRPLWRNASGSMARIILVPGGAELWYDDRDIAFLREDLKDIAEVQQMNGAAMKSAIDSGFEPNAIIKWLASNDLSELIDQHTGLTSVQLQPPATGGTFQMNGKGTAMPAIPAAT